MMLMKMKMTMTTTTVVNYTPVLWYHHWNSTRCSAMIYDQHSAGDVVAEVLARSVVKVETTSVVDVADYIHLKTTIPMC